MKKRPVAHTCGQCIYFREMSRCIPLRRKVVVEGVCACRHKDWTKCEYTTFYGVPACRQFRGVSA